ncbi:MAG: YceD family protein [Ancrocorticia sp.]
MDLRSPFVASLQSLPRQEGSVMTWEQELPAPADMGVELIGVPEGSPMAISLELQSVSEGVFVQGTVGVTLEGQCSRCLRDLALDEHENVAELVFYPERKAAFVADGDEEAEEFPEIIDDHIDLEPILRDAVVIGLPFRPLCRPDCPGLCSECGEAWDNLPDDHRHEKFDPRFDALAALQAQLVGGSDDADGAGSGDDAGVGAGDDARVGSGDGADSDDETEAK